MKALRIQIDMLYQVPDGVSEELMTRDIEFFEGIKQSFGAWADNPNDPRDPVNFDLRYHVGEVIDDTNEEE